MTTQHTPGPWLAIVTETTGNGNPAIWDIACKNGGIIAESIGHNQADARLIAAAPDLLSALNRFVDCMTENENGEKLYADWLSIARAAIAKAEGDKSK